MTSKSSEVARGMADTVKPDFRPPLIVDAVYEGVSTSKGGLTDPLTLLAGVSRQGGFRYRGSRENPRLVILTTSLAEVEWPDELDTTSGRFTYYGDNRHPGQELLKTPRFGNALLQLMFERLHEGRRAEIPPILVFSSLGAKRSVRFLGLAVPGAENLGTTEDLVAIWKSTGGQRFQNYRAIFTLLDVARVDQVWLQNAIAGRPLDDAPLAWTMWVRNGRYQPLRAPHARVLRSRKEQMPSTKAGAEIMAALRSRYQSSKADFEYCAAALCRLLLPDVASLDVTRQWMDGGRDAVGELRIGSGPASIKVTFALEAKCYSEHRQVSVRDTSRLISRIRHREFGVLVTTTALHHQAYAEIIADNHPIIIVAARDIEDLLYRNGVSTVQTLQNWLDALHEEQTPRRTIA